MNSNTDFNFLNQKQNSLVFKMSGQREDYLNEFQSQFNLFAIENIGFEMIIGSVLGFQFYLT